MSDWLEDSDLSVDGEAEEAVATVPMLQEPYAPPVRRGRHLSPLMFYSMTHQARTDVEGLGEDFGLVEEPCGTIDKRGVERLKRFYTHPELQAYITGNKRVPQRNLVIRYDRALAARGVLEEMQLLERDEQGRYTRLLDLVPQEKVQERWSQDEIVRLRNAYAQALLKKNSGGERAYVMVQRGAELMDRLVEDTLARERLQRRQGKAPLPAAPIIDGEEPEQAADRLATALEEASALGLVPAPGTVPEPDDGETTAPDLREALSRSASRPSAAGTDAERDQSATQSMGLGEVLGGTIAIRRRK